MNIEWIKNKSGEKFYPISHEKSILCGENSDKTLEDKLNELASGSAVVGEATKATFDGDGNKISETYAKNSDVSSSVANLQSQIDTKVPNTRKVNGKALSADISLTASDVGADASGAAAQALTDAKEYNDAAYANANLYTDQKIADLINGAPTTLDTLKEIADAMAEHVEVVEALDEAIGSKANQSELDTHTGNNTIHITNTDKTAWNKNTTDISNIISGTTAVGNALQLGGKGASEYALAEELTKRPLAFTSLASATEADSYINDYSANLTDDTTYEFEVNIAFSNYELTTGVWHINGTRVNSLYEIQTAKSYVGSATDRVITVNRAKVNGTWSAWVENATTADLANYLPLSGGTVTTVSGSTILPQLPMIFENGIDENGSVVQFADQKGALGHIGFQYLNIPIYSDIMGNVYPLIHSGNVSDYALPSNYGAGSHNAIYRGRDITSLYDDGTFSTQVANGAFTDIYPGDYITKTITYEGSSYTIQAIVADLDYHYGYASGDATIGEHHVAVILTGLPTAQMNETDTTEGGYAGSKMHTTTLPVMLEAIKVAFGSDHIITHKKLLSAGIGASLYNRFGSASGASSTWAWYDSAISLMTEAQIYGSTVWSSSGYDTGEANRQLAVFRLKNFNAVLGWRWLWLRDVASGSSFCNASNSGYAVCGNASNAGHVCPLILLK